ncbi:MAG: GFA family protein, partial [Myxococcota bacterium]
MRLEGSCHCGALRFELESQHPYPFNLCYCSICRKT